MGLDNLIAKSTKLDPSTKEYSNNILTMNTIKKQIRDMGGEVDEDEIPDRLAKTDTTRFGPTQMSSGGTVYASQGSHINFQPRGTDTVPAMLTPGEFVVNRASTAKNLPLLRAINNRGSYYNRGGAVKYLAEGGGPDGPSGVYNSVKLDIGDFSASTTTFLSGIDLAFKDGARSIAEALGSLGNIKNAFSGLGGVTTGLTTAATLLQTNMGSLSTSLTNIATVLADIPKSIDFKVSGSIPINITVDVNGGDGLEAKLKPFSEQIFQAIEVGLKNAFPLSGITFDKTIVTD